MNQRLITWLDVQKAVLEKSGNGSMFPTGLVGVRCYWDGLTLIKRHNSPPDPIRAWLGDIFGPSLLNDDFGDKVALISKNGDKRSLPVIWEELSPSEALPPLPWLPLFRPPKRLPVNLPKLPAERGDKLPQLIAFHSFKGGVGRTTHALALADMLAKGGAGVLIVDADLEAPGISWMLHDRFPAPAISLADVLALAHGDITAGYKLTIDLAVQELQRLQEGGFYFLPAFRSMSQLEELEIRPEYIIEGQANPFALSDLLWDIGAGLGIDYIVLDLRAGMSEFASGFLFDPRIHRVFVTTLSAQSRKGIEMVLDAVMPITGHSESAGIAVIVSQVPLEWMRGVGAVAMEELLGPIVTRLIDSENSTPPQLEDLPSQSEHPLVRTSFSDLLSVLPGDLPSVIRAIEGSGITKELLPLLDWLPEKSKSGGDSKNSSASTISLDDRREKLSAYGRQLIFAESGETWDFLSTVPLRNLARDNANAVPITLVIGAKGAGKTYSFLQLAHSQTWKGFCSQLLPSHPSSADALILPVLSSLNLKPAAQAVVDAAKERCVEQLGLKLPGRPLNDYVRDWLREDIHEGKWRDRWFDFIAWNAGFEVGVDGAGNRFPNFLAEKGISVIAAFDGLEDMFQDFLDNEHQETALRSLFQEVPNWLEKIPVRSLGLSVFVRQDLVERTIKQNSSQLRSRYEPYALRWNRTEGLKLVKWTLVKADVLQEASHDWEQTATVEDLESDLKQLWGRKLGRENGKNANSAKFVTLALSDYNGRLQARDVVRFLAEAAKRSVGNGEWNERLLTPSAIQQAIKECGRERIGEIKAENPKLGNVLDKLATIAVDLRIPAKRDELKLLPEEVTLLESNAVLFKDGDDYYMPEFLRQGMGLQLRGGSRPKLFSLLALRNKD